jgi:hypothetical protein
VADSDATSGRVYWGKGVSAAAATDARQPVAVGTDGMGRVLVVEGITAGSPKARVLRYPQRSPGGAGAPVFEDLSGPLGVAVDTVGNIYVVEVGKARISLVTYDGTLYSWAADGLADPRYLAFTQY